MDKTKLDKLEALAKAATKGPWILSKYGSVMDGEKIFEVVPVDTMREDREYIAASNPAAILELIRLARAGIAAPTLCPSCEAEPARNGGACGVCFWKGAAPTAAQKEGTSEQDAKDAARWRFFCENASAHFKGRKLADWLAFDGVMEYGTRAAAIDAAMSAAQAQPKDTTKGQA